ELVAVLDRLMVLERLADPVDHVVESDIPIRFHDDLIQILANDVHAGRSTHRGQLYRQTLRISDDTKVFRHGDHGTSVDDLSRAPEVGPRFGAFQTDIADDFRCVSGMGLYEVFRYASHKVATRINAVAGTSEEPEIERPTSVDP